MATTIAAAPPGGLKGGLLAFAPPRRDRSAPAVTEDGDRPIAPVRDAGGETLKGIYEAHGREVLGYVTAALHDRAVAEEVTQEVFLRVWLHADRFDPARGTPRTWIFSIARNLVIDTIRRRAARPHALGVSEDAMGAGGDDIERAELRLVVVEALRRLTPDHREVVAHVVLGGEDLRETARRLGVPLGTVKSRLFYGLAGLRLAVVELEFAR